MISLGLDFANATRSFTLSIGREGCDTSRLVATVASATGVIGLFLLHPQLLGVYGADVLNRSVPLLPMHLLPKATSRWLQERLRQA